MSHGLGELPLRRFILYWLQTLKRSKGTYKNGSDIANPDAGTG